MFGRPIPEFEPSPENRAESIKSMNPLIQAVQAAIEVKQLQAQEAEPLAMMLWAAAHGIVSLELSGYLEPALGEALYKRTIHNLLQSQGWNG